MLCAICAQDSEGTDHLDCNRPPEGTLICPACQRQGRRQISAMVCALDNTFPAGLLLGDFRQGGQLQLAPVLAGLMADAAQRAWRYAMPHAWVPLPLSHAQLLQNGFSPPQQLAQIVSRQTNTDWHLRWLRLANSDSPTDPIGFEATPDVAGLAIGLVTDVVDTGATVRAAAQALLDAGAKQVMVLAAGCAPKVNESGTIAACSM